MFVPSRIFFTKGVGIHKDRLASFELALRKAGIEKCNLVYVSSIFPPKCKQIPSRTGLRELLSGGITFCVMARNETNEPNRLVSAAVGLALPKDVEEYGYLSEHHAYGETQDRTGSMPKIWRQRCLQRRWASSSMQTPPGRNANRPTRQAAEIVRTKHVCQSAQGDKNGLWTTVIAAAVFL